MQLLDSFHPQEVRISLGFSISLNAKNERLGQAIAIKINGTVPCGMRQRRWSFTFLSTATGKHREIYWKPFSGIRVLSKARFNVTPYKNISIGIHSNGKKR